MILTRRSALILGAGATAAGGLGLATAGAATVYTSSGSYVLKSGTRIATALSTAVALSLSSNLNNNPSPGSSYKVSGGTGVYRISQSRVIATATSTANATAIVALLNANHAPGTPPTTSRSWLSGYGSGDSSAAGKAAFASSYYAPHVYTGYDDNYASWPTQANAFTGWLVPERMPQNSGYATGIAMGLVLHGGSNSGKLQAASTGADLGHWVATGRAMLAGGWNDPSTVCRIGHEMNGGWYPWSTSNNPTLAGYFRSAFRYAVQGIRQSCPKVRFNVCFNAGSGGTSVIANHYPGDDSVDILGLDFYDGNALGHIATTTADFVKAQQGLGFAEIAAFAHAHGKLFSLDEWACNGSLSNHDNPFYVQQVFNTLGGLQKQYPGIVAYDTWFNSVEYGTFGLAKNPNAAALYRKLWNS